MLNNFPPIVLFVYNRPEHTLKTLLKLTSCDHAHEVDLFIFADGQKNNASDEQIAKIQAVKAIIYQQKWCKNVYIEIATQNKGLAKSVRDGVTKIINQYGKAIILEDDLEPAKGMISYLHNALLTYENEQKVWGISAFAHPLHNYSIQEDTFFLPIPCSWGWATWKRSWDSFLQNNENEIAKNINNKLILPQEYNFGQYYFFEILLAQLEGKVDSWAAIFHATMYLNKGVFLFPKFSLINNIGFDNAGTHTFEDDFFSTHQQADYVNVEKKVVQFSPATKSVSKAFAKHFGKKTILQRIVRKISSLF